MTTVPGMATVLERLSSATSAELRAFDSWLDARINKQEQELGFKLESNPQVAATLLALKFREIAGRDYRELLRDIANQASKQVEWDIPEHLELTTAESIDRVEDYIYLANEAKFGEAEKIKELKMEAAKILQGEAPTPKERIRRMESVAILGVGAAMLMGAAAGAIAASAIALFSPSMRKLGPATLLLIHIRKRQQFEDVLSARPAA